MIFTLNRDKSRRLIEGLTEPAIIVRGASVVMSNRAARNLLGVAIEGVDVRQVLPHPALVERLVRAQPNTVVHLPLSEADESDEGMEAV